MTSESFYHRLILVARAAPARDDRIFDMPDSVAQVLHW